MKKAKTKTFLAILTAVIMLIIPLAAMAADPPAPVAKTGQTTCYDLGGNVVSCPSNGQDSDLQKGVTSPIPRFTDNGDGTVTDNLTGLMWTKDANLYERKIWGTALDHANNLSLGSDGCGTSYTDWRLPNVKELQSLIDFGNEAPALSSGHPFINVGDKYWSSTTIEAYSLWAGCVTMRTGSALIG
jgi:hypothetical protein